MAILGIEQQTFHILGNHLTDCGLADVMTPHTLSLCDFFKTLVLYAPY
jgi:hypothetical protein